MKYEVSEPFLADYARLSPAERALFRAAVQQVNPAYERAEGKWPPRWPTALRIKAVQGAPGIWEMTWSFAGPQGRASFEFRAIDGDPAVRWRRIGGHDIFRRP